MASANKMNGRTAGAPRLVQRRWTLSNTRLQLSPESRLNTEHILQQFHEMVSNQIRLVPDGVHRYRVLTPLLFEDGDSAVIVLKRKAGSWLLTDEGHTHMHLSFDLHTFVSDSVDNSNIVTSIQAFPGLVDRDSELILEISNEEFGTALKSFMEALSSMAGSQIK